MAAKSTKEAAPKIVPIDVGAEGVRIESIEQPTVTALIPDTAECGDTENIVMIVEGTGFHPKSVITFNGLDEPTTFISQTQVSTGVKPSLFVVPAVCPVAVRNAGFAPSNEMPFTFAGDEPALTKGKGKADVDVDVDVDKSRSKR
jgi:hypothetical protein